MRKLFVECKHRDTAKRRAPWACRIAKVESGFYAFESESDYQIWRNQK